jgi:hypothetical protein
MINRNDEKKSDIKKPVQRGLFDPPTDMLHDPGPGVKAAMRDSEKEAMQNFSVSRENIIDAMNHMAEAAGITCNGKARRVTLAIYNKWLSASEKHVIPLRLLPIFCRAVRSNRALEAYTSFFIDVRIIPESEIKKLQWAEVEIQKRRLSVQAKQLAQEVGL